MAGDANLHNTSNSYWYDLFSWAYAGVDFTLPGNGGSECVNFLSPQQRLVESGLASLLAFFICYKAYPRLTLPATKLKSLTEGEAAGKRLLLVLMCLTWGCELGFKFATRQMIWIFNPCHVATAVQIYLLAAAPSKAVTAAFRLHMHMLTGAPIAILFPVINTRLLPFETEVYYVQHILMLVIPFYLMSLGDPYIPERLGDFSWAAMTFGVAFLYHFIPLQILAMDKDGKSIEGDVEMRFGMLGATGVNLNNMLCPAISDPFHGPFYRLFAIAHQTLLIPSLGKIYAALARRLGWCPIEEEESVSEMIMEELAASASEEENGRPRAAEVRGDRSNHNVTSSSGEKSYRSGSNRVRENNRDAVMSDSSSSGLQYTQQVLSDLSDADGKFRRVASSDSGDAGDRLNQRDVSDSSSAEAKLNRRVISDSSSAEDRLNQRVVSDSSSADEKLNRRVMSGSSDAEETLNHKAVSGCNEACTKSDRENSWSNGLRNRDVNCAFHCIVEENATEKLTGNGHLKDH